MTYAGHIKDGQILLDEPTPLPEGARVTVEIERIAERKSFRESRMDGFKPIQIAGDSLAEQIIRDRR
jgi:hypothetical protein